MKEPHPILLVALSMYAAFGGFKMGTVRWLKELISLEGEFCSHVALIFIPRDPSLSENAYLVGNYESRFITTFMTY